MCLLSVTDQLCLIDQLLLFPSFQVIRAPAQGSFDKWSVIFVQDPVEINNSPRDPWSGPQKNLLAGPSKGLNARCFGTATFATGERATNIVALSNWKR